MLSNQFRVFISFALLFCFSPICFGQPQEVRVDRGGGLQAPRPRTPTLEIRNALRTVLFETKGFHDEKPFSEFLKKFEASVSKKGKEVCFEIDEDAFQNDKEKFHDLAAQQIRFPAVPQRFTAHTALQWATAQTAKGAEFWVRSGQIVITSTERVNSTHFLESRIEAKFTNRPLTDALAELAEQSGVSIIVDRRVENRAQTKVNARIAGKLETAVHLLADAAGLQALTVDNVLYVTSATNASEFKGKTDFKLNERIRGVALKTRPLSSALDDLYGSNDWHGWCNWVIDSRVKKQTNARVTATWINHVHADTALRIMTDMAGLKHVVVDDVVYVTTPANAKRIAEERAQRKP